MSMWKRSRSRRLGAAVIGALTLALATTACGTGGTDTPGKDPAVSTPAATGEGKGGTPGEGGTTVPDTSRTLATINGSNGFQFLVHSAARDEGGFLTVTGAITNTSSKGLAPRVVWSGQEKQVRATGRSLAGITLVDKNEKKRYYVLRDTDGYPLTTTGIDRLDAGESVTFFAQFPAPPATTTEVDILVPEMPVATIELS
ncbi:hypothetical protein NPS70_15315 [Streptomyces sp. C10-9-1]|uniref:hypothetical protein n=1 Tax=Streptomyces sp. C10-9-1 TaxID=1859285 RepID=UPI002111E0D5|nr:hypothetical protein [Streptomyces sp. C10-9-1]MCQ6554555.1 hypothetical protein [Streptomyces sp. C10-9-1]